MFSREMRGQAVAISMAVSIIALIVAVIALGIVLLKHDMEQAVYSREDARSPSKPFLDANASFQSSPDNPIEEGSSDGSANDSLALDVYVLPVDAINPSSTDVESREIGEYLSVDWKQSKMRTEETEGSPREVGAFIEVPIGQWEGIDQ